MNNSNSSNSSNTTAMISYCKHTATKLVASTSFKNSRTASKYNLVPSEHGIFALALPVIYDIFSEVQTPTEQYIAMTAYLVNLGVVSTRDMPMTLETNDLVKVLPIFKQLAVITLSIVSDRKRLARLRDEVPMLMVNDSTNGKSLKDHLKYCISIIEASSISRYCTVLQKELSDSGMALDRIADLYSVADAESELVMALASYRTNSTVNARYSRRLGAWAIKQIIANTEDDDTYNSKVIEAIRNAIFQPTDNLDADQLKKIILLVKEGLTYEDHEREQSLLVVRMLESKLEDMLSISFAFGFVTVEKETSKNTGAGMKYETRTKIVSVVNPVTNRNPEGKTALERMRNKFKTASNASEE